MNLKENFKNIIEIPKSILNPLADNAKKYYFSGDEITSEELLERLKVLENLYKGFLEGKVFLQDYENEKNFLDIEKSLGSEEFLFIDSQGNPHWNISINDLKKGFYKNNSLNRRLGRVNLPYGKDKVAEFESLELEKVNQTFNDLLSKFNEETADSIIFSLGMPSSILRAAGIENKSIRLRGDKLLKKIKKHHYSVEDIKNLPREIADPIAVFNNRTDRSNNRSVLVDLKINQHNVLVAIELGRDNEADFNIVSTLFGKERGNIEDWLSRKLNVYINKNKLQKYLASPHSMR